MTQSSSSAGKRLIAAAQSISKEASYIVEAMEIQKRLSDVLQSAYAQGFSVTVEDGRILIGKQDGMRLTSFITTENPSSK